MVLKIGKTKRSEKDMKLQVDLWAKTVPWFPRANEEKLMIKRHKRKISY